MTSTPQSAHAHREGEEGYLLLGLVVVCFLILLALSVAAPRVAKQLERDREVESEHRALEYVRAIQLYYKKNGAYPSSIDVLMGSGATGGVSALNVKYLRQKYKDPLTNDEYRPIHFGEAQTEVKGFFGAPLEGAPGGGSNLGSVAGMQSSNGGGNSSNGIGAGTSPTSPAGGASGTGSNSFGSGGFSLGGSNGTGGAGSTSAGTNGTTGSSTGTGTSTPGTSGTGGTSATTFTGSKGAIVGVGSNGKGPAIVAWNGSDDIAKWEFLYDPRVELLKAKVSIFGGTPAATGSGSLTNVNGISGTSTPGSSIGNSIGGTSTPGTTPGGTTGTPTGSGTGTSGTGTPPIQ